MIPPARAACGGMSFLGPLQGPAGLVLSAACFGLNVIPTRLAGAAGVGGPDLAAARSLVFFAAIALYALATRAALAVPRGERLTLAGFGVTGALIGVGYLSAVAFVPVGVAVMIFYTYPVLIALATPFVDGRRLTGAALFAFVLAGVGLALAVGGQASGLDWRGVALAGLASLAAAAQLFFGSRAPGGGGFVTMFWSQVVMIPILLGTALAVGPAPLDAWARAPGAAAMVVMFYLGAFVLQVVGMRSSSAAAAGVIYCLEPIVAIAGAAAFLGERLSLAQYLGAALVLAGVAIEIGSRSFPPRRERRA